MNGESPWTTCFLTRMLILYLEQIGKGKGVDYDQVLKGEDPLDRIDHPKAFLTDHNNWVPHAVLKNLIEAAEKAAGSKEVAYLAAKNYFRSNQSPSFLEIIAKLLDTMEQALICSNHWATGYTNYLKLQCVMAPDAGRPSEVIFLSQFGLNVEPAIGNVQLILGNIEGTAEAFDPAAGLTCMEEISQLKIESMAKEFKGCHVEKKDDQIVIFDPSNKEAVTAKKVYLKPETFSAYFIGPTSSEDRVVAPEKGKVPVIGLVREENPNEWTGKNSAYEIVKEGTLRSGELAFSFRKGQLFNAPYSRYRIKWTPRKVQRETSEIARSREERILPLFNHLRELRETHRRLMRCSMENKALAKANEALKGEIRRESDFFGIIGKSAPMQKLFDQVRLIAPADSTVLIMGATGTGKELLAKAIHQSSFRRELKFYAVNCAALAESLLESELFGYEKGAFTGALTQRKGIFEMAHGGTLFLDEVGEISLMMQAKLLRVLEEQEIQRVGGRETVPIDVRIISATNRNLEELVDEGKFRRDLYYRLHVISLTVPPLKERIEDLLLLVDHFLSFFSRKCKKAKPAISREALTLLAHYPWPGNIRQLKNVIERAVVLDRDQLITGEDILLPGESPKQKEEEAAPHDFHQSLDHHKRSIIEEALKKAGGNQTRAAALLGLQRTYLARLIRVLNISKA
ncbi:MAG TPA: sigma-54 dependent transcriptional regulator [Candidatus Manganitrophaceae bacterium]|nr:sigma-54 dependent transcriptional regulator [Candidatus Manganitrophaceae bacterium]